MQCNAMQCNAMQCNAMRPATHPFRVPRWCQHDSSLNHKLTHPHARTHARGWRLCTAQRGSAGAGPSSSTTHATTSARGSASMASRTWRRRTRRA
jgi:hypothetical protein